MANTLQSYDMIILAIALPIVWILTVVTKKGASLKNLYQPISLAVFLVLLCMQYFYYLAFTQCCVSPIWGALGFSLFPLLIGEDDDLICDVVRAFILEYALLLLPNALYAVGGATLWLVSVSIASTLCRHL